MTTKLKLVFFLFIINLGFQVKAQNVITSDVSNFWMAYDKITQTKDSTLQYQYLNDLYFSKATDGLKAIRKARNYTAQDYINAINSYPKFWSSVRTNTLKTKKFSKELERGIEKLRKVYPHLTPAKIYFTIGALRTNGTVSDSSVLIGSELAMADENTISDELPENVRKGRRSFFDSNPIKNLVLLNVHEYVHTQQKPVINNLLSFVISEGVAEFVSVKAMNVSSATPAIDYGKRNAEKVRAKFEQEMFYINNQGKWLWSDAQNEFGVRDLGYYIGYQICENFYEQAENKNEAIKTMIELDYSNEAEIEDFVKKANFFSKSLQELYQDFEKNQPTVIGIQQFKNKDVNVSSKIKEITIQFSEPLNGYNTGVDYGSLGEIGFPKNDRTKRYWSNDNKSWTITVDLEPNKKYEIVITSNFRTEKGLPLKEYSIEFETGK